MLKQHKGKLILSSVLILLPLLAGLLLWDRLPDTLATHFGGDNLPNGWSSKAFTVFGLPLFILAIHWLCLLVTSSDPKRQNISTRLFGLLVWLCPLLSLFCGVSIYAYALGGSVNTSFFTTVLIGLILMVIGNYLPKCKQNYTMGIKLPWTLHSTENWNRTHRLAGPLWMAGGAILIITAAFPVPWLMVAVLLVLALVPPLYSYGYYRKYERGKE